MIKQPRVLFLFNRRRGKRQELFAEGRCPDDALYGFNALKKRGFDTFFSDAGHDVSGTGLLSRRVGDLLSARGRRVGFHLWQARQLLPEIQKADLIFATADSSALPVLRYKAKGRVRAPVVYGTIGLTAGFPEGRGLVFSYYRRLLKQADRIIHFAKAEGPDLVEKFRADEKRVRFIPFGVDVDFYRREPSEEDAPVAFGLDPRRDWALLARALAGTGVNVDVHTHLDHLARIDLPPEFRAHPPVLFEDLAERTARARFVVLPVEQNPYSGATISLLSAMASGKAVIVSRTSAVEEGYGLLDGENCVLVPPGDEAALRSAVSELHSDVGRCRELGERARLHVRANFSVDRMADDLADLFREVLA